VQAIDKPAIDWKHHDSKNAFDEATFPSRAAIHCFAGRSGGDGNQVTISITG
jgi:hypothetical protein